MALPSKLYNPETGNLEYPNMNGLIILNVIAIVLTPIVVITVCLLSIFNK